MPDTSLNWRAVETPLWNSVLITLVTLAGTLALAVPAAYFLARVRSRWRGWLFALVLFSLAIPGVVLLLPQFQEVAWLGLINTRGWTGLSFTSRPTSPWPCCSCDRRLPASPKPLVESMRVDGVSSFGVVWRLFLPLSTSTFVAVTVFVVVQVWGEVPLAVTLLNSPSRFPLSIFLALISAGPGPSRSDGCRSCPRWRFSWRRSGASETARSTARCYEPAAPSRSAQQARRGVGPGTGRKLRRHGGTRQPLLSTLNKWRTSRTARARAP